MKWTSNPALKCILNLIWSVRGSIIINADLKKGNVEQIQNSLPENHRLAVVADQHRVVPARRRGHVAGPRRARRHREPTERVESHRLAVVAEQHRVVPASRHC